MQSEPPRRDPAAPGHLPDGEVPEIDVQTFADLHAAGVPLIDVREPDEYETTHVPGAQLIPLGTVPERLDEVPTDRTVYVICGVGARSHKAADFYRRQGIDAVNIAGGTAAWIEAQYPTATGTER
jgi:rhodanese-related sulfurtransferase